MNVNEPFLSPPIKYLMTRGVKISNPLSVELGPEVNVDSLCHEGVEIHGPARIEGEYTSFGPGAKIGTEGPVTIFDCQLGAEVELAAGSFTSSVFLDRARMGPNAHVREACLLEEQASGAHGVGLKHTILFPFVTLGSLINFCDCLMAGGTSRQEHSEVGSSFIHFNFTPNQDKATCSLLGDVPRGVMLREPPIFLGGQGCIVGPIILGYGTVTKAGTIVRQDDPKGGHIWGNTISGSEKKPFYPGLYPDLGRRIKNNVLYIANVMALHAWYRHVRSLFFTQVWERAILEGAIRVLERILEERRRRLEELAGKMDTCIRAAERAMDFPHKSTIIAQAREFKEKWPQMAEVLKLKAEGEPGAKERETFLESLLSIPPGGYLTTIKSLEPEIRRKGVQWLQKIVDETMERAMVLVPACRS